MRVALLLGSAALFWLLFMAAHESGHVLGALATGGKVTHVVLHPLAISRTDVMPNPHPLAVCWAGPLWGAGMPMLGLAVWLVMRAGGAAWWRGFAGFCCVANGVYIASGAVFPAGDTEELLRMGVPVWVMVVVGVPMVGAGFWLWHVSGAWFGVGAMARREVRQAAGWTLAGVALAAGIMAMLG